MGNTDPVTGRLLSAAVMFVILYAIAIPFYMVIEGLTLIESIYFVTVSITSAGYGDITPRTDVGRIFTSILLLAGVSIFFYHVTHFGQFKERSIDPHIQRRLQVLRNLTALQTGEVESSQLKKIREKINSRNEEPKERRDDRPRGFGSL
ncbi:MAG: potassium channel family protein [Candidatus Micrarchaeota archaeon]